MSETPSTAALVALVEQKNKILVRILQHVATQKQTIAERRVAELMPLLAAKQALLEELQQVERDLDPFRKEDPESRTWSSQTARVNCRMRVDENRKLLNDILLNEKECEQQLVQQREQTAKRLDANLDAANAVKTYQPIKSPKQGSLNFSSEA